RESSVACRAQGTVITREGTGDREQGTAEIAYLSCLPFSLCGSLSPVPSFAVDARRGGRYRPVSGAGEDAPAGVPTEVRMTRQTWLVFLGACLCFGLLPGCATVFPFFRKKPAETPKDGDQAQYSPFIGRNFLVDPLEAKGVRTAVLPNSPYSP